MSEHRSERGARVYRLDEFRARRLPSVPLVIEPDGTWHRPTSEDRAAAAARHPSAVAQGRRHAN